MAPGDRTKSWKNPTGAKVRRPEFAGCTVIADEQVLGQASDPLSFESF